MHVIVTDQVSLEAAAFFTMMNNPNLMLDHCLSSERVDTLLRFVEAHVGDCDTCGRRGIAFRGHCDDTPTRKNPHANHGNSFALQQFRVKSSDHTPKWYLNNAAGNALYTSETVENNKLWPYH